MLGNGGTGNGKRVGDAAGCQVTVLAEQVEDGAARGIGERNEDSLSGIRNRTVTHNA